MIFFEVCLLLDFLGFERFWNSFSEVFIEKKKEKIEYLVKVKILKRCILVFCWYSRYMM